MLVFLLVGGFASLLLLRVDLFGWCRWLVTWFVVGGFSEVSLVDVVWLWFVIVDCVWVLIVLLLCTTHLTLSYRFELRFV